MLKNHVVLLVTICIILYPFSVMAGTDSDPLAKSIMERTWKGYTGNVQFEAFQAEEDSTGGRKKPRTVEAWINHVDGNAQINIGWSRNPAKRPGSLFLANSDGDLFGLTNEFVNNRRNRRPAPKPSGFSPKTRGTQASEADIWSLLFGELKRIDHFNYSFSGTKKMNIVVSPKKSRDGDYATRIFRLLERRGMLVVKGIDYYSDKGKWLKTLENDSLEVGEFWRPGVIVILSKEGRTKLKIERRVFEREFTLNAESLRLGQPKGWKW